MKKVTRRMLGVVLSIALLLTNVSLTAFATEKVIESISAVATKTLAEGMDGYWCNEGMDDEYCHYNENYFGAEITIHYSDNTTFVGDYYEVLDETGIWPYFYSNQSFENQWGVGIHTVSVELDEFSCDMEVEIIENPIESISAVATKTVIEGTGGRLCEEWMDEDTCEEYYRYYEDVFGEEITIQYKNGDSFVGDRYEIDEETGMWLEFSSDQSYENPWGVGKHNVEVSVGTISCNMEVEIVESPIERITAVATETVMEGTGGWLREEEIDVETYEEYYYYDIQNTFDAEITVYYKDGREPFVGTMYDVEEEIGVFPEFSSDQSYENQWDVGKHKVTVSIGILSCDMEVEITENPIESISAVAKSTILEGTNGDWEDDEGQEYYYYYVSELDVEITIEYKDGTTFTGDEYEVEEEIGIWPSFSSDQSYENQWGVGKHTITVSVGTLSCDMEVEIVESPIKSISAVATNPVIEGSRGAWEYDWNGEDSEEQYYCYDVYNFSEQITIEYKDGTTFTGDKYEVEEEIGISALFSSDQSYENQWGIGKHTVIVSVGMFSCDMEVEIVENPINNISAVSTKKVIERTNGYQVDEDSEEKYFNYYEDHFGEQITIEYKDGTTFTGDAYEVEEEIGISALFSSDQSYENQWGIGKHTVTISMGFVSCDMEVEILESPYESVEIKEIFSKNPDDDLEFTFLIHYKDGREETGYYGPKYWDKFGNDFSVDQDGFTFALKFFGLKATGHLPSPLPTTDYTYILQDKGVVITGTSLVDKKVLSIPSTIDGKKVTGISRLVPKYYDDSKIEHVVVPDSVEVLNDDWLEGCDVKTVTIGSGVKYLDCAMFVRMQNCESVTIASDNPYYQDVNGIVYNKAKDTLVYYPLVKGDTYVVPDYVENIDVLRDHLEYHDIKIDYSGNNNFKIVDGVTYNKSMTKIITCDPEKQGEYTMPSSVKSIATAAFSNCEGLTSVNISNSVTTIAYMAFSGCSNLTSIKLPDELVRVERLAFGDSPLEKLEINNMAAWCSADIQDIPWQRNTVLYVNGQPQSTLVIPDGVTSITPRAFAYYSTGTSVDLPNTLKEIGEDAFYNSGIETLDVPNSVEEIDESAFGNCSKLKTVEFGIGLEKINNYAFGRCEKLTNVKFHGNVEYIGDSAFFGCKQLDVELPSGIKHIGMYAFENTAISNLQLNGVTSIAYGAFENNLHLTEVDLPDSLESLEAHAFEFTKWYEEQNDGIVYNNNILYNYKGNMNTSTKSVSVKEGTLLIGDSAFENQKSIEKVSLPDSLKHIGKYAFYECTNLKEITIPKAVKNIGKDAFYGCDLLDEIYVDEENQYYSSVDGVVYNKDGTELIYCGKNVESFIVPSKVQKIHEMAFANSNVKKVTILNPNTFIEGNIFDKYYQSDVAILGFKDSTAEKYADEYVISFEEFICKTHQYSTDVTKASLTKNGIIKKVCDYCGDTKETTIYYPKTIKLSTTSYTYDGKAKTPSVTVIDANNKTIPSSNYKVTYASGRTNPGTYKVTVAFNGNYSGTKTLTFSINLKLGKPSVKASQTTTTAKLSWGKVSGANGYEVYNSSKKQLASTTKLSYTVSKLKAGTAYTYYVRAYKKIGSKTYYSDYVKVGTATKPKTPTLKVKAGSKKATLTWSKQTGTGYEIHMSTKKSSSYSKVKTVTSYKTVKYTKTKLKKGKKYYFKIRAYKTVNGKKVYGSYSSVKSVKVK